MYIKYGGRTLFLTGEASWFPSGPAKCEIFNEADPCILFLTCNISQCSPNPSCPRFFSFKYAFATLSKLCYPLEGGIVFEVAFGGVSDGMGTSCIECARAEPVTYRRDRR
jgi:hypothetical protein